MIVIALWQGEHDVNGGSCKHYVYNFMKEMLATGYIDSMNHSSIFGRRRICRQSSLVER